MIVDTGILVALADRDARIGYVDGVTIAMAERLKERRLATIDRRHFLLVKPRHTEAFELLP